MNAMDQRRVHDIRNHDVIIETAFGSLLTIFDCVPTKTVLVGRPLESMIEHLFASIKLLIYLLWVNGRSTPNPTINSGKDWMNVKVIASLTHLFVYSLIKIGIQH